MQNCKKTAFFVLTSIVVGASTLDAQAQTEVKVNAELSAKKIAPNVWFVEGETALGSKENRNFISNAAFISTPKGVVVIDALGSPSLARELITQVRKITARPIKAVIVTHYHADHIYGLQEFKRIGAQIIAQKASLNYIHSELALQRLADSRKLLSPWIDESTRIVEADRWLSAPIEYLKLGGAQFQLLHVGPAHTPEDTLIWLPDSRILFAGDLVFRGRIPFVGQADSKQWIASLDRALELKPKLIVPGHGPVSTNAIQDLQLTRDYLQFLRDSMKQAAQNLEPFDEAYAKVDWSRFETLPLFRVANRMNAYNTYLLLERE